MYNMQCKCNSIAQYPKGRHQLFSTVNTWPLILSLVPSRFYLCVIKEAGHETIYLT